MSVETQPVQVASGEQDRGLLVFNDGWLIAVLVRLSAKHGVFAGQWFLESGYGRFSGREQLTFVDEIDAIAWFNSHLADHYIDDPWNR